jgi:hypothetical protein
MLLSGKEIDDKTYKKLFFEVMNKK